MTCCKCVCSWLLAGQTCKEVRTPLYAWPVWLVVHRRVVVTFCEGLLLMVILCAWHRVQHNVTLGDAGTLQ